MMLTIMLYGLIVGMLAAFGSWLIELAQIVFGKARRFAWMGGIAAALIVPALVVGLREPGSGITLPATGNLTLAAIAPAATGVATPANLLSLPPVTAWRIDGWLAGAWALTSFTLVATYGVSAWRLRRRARAWPDAHLDQSPVMVAPDVGPAVFGWASPRVVFPNWMIEAPAEVQRLALTHEREHLVARDPQVLTVATLLVALLPWNIPLRWMLRRLRFAMEVDCDARVVRKGADPEVYGLALLYVSERQSRSPLTAIALIERTSQLEKRINFMFHTPRKHRALVAGLCLALAGSCLYAATKLDAPSLGADLLVLKLPPGGSDSPGMRLGQRFEVLLREKYPELLAGQFEGTPIVVTVINPDWSIAQSAMTSSNLPIDEVKVDEGVFGIVGLSRDAVPYVGNMAMRIVAGSSKAVLVAYTEKSKAGERFFSQLFPDTRKQDRELFAQQFPDAKKPVAAGQQPWLLIDRAGVVLRRGIEATAPEFHRVLERRYEGIGTREVTMTALTNDAGEPLVDAAGHEVHLLSVWLAPGSPAPQN
jgi:hypothetical protein